MRIAIFSDLHGNAFACQAVAQAVRRCGEFDAIVAAGDHCLGGSQPARCVDLLWELNAQAVYGNTDEYLRNPDQPPPDERHLAKWDWLLPAAHWTNTHLRPEQRRWLDELPFSLRFSPTAHPQDDLLVVHANPLNNELMIYPPEAEQVRLYGQVRQPDNDPELRHYLAGVQAHTLAFGHIHITAQRRLAGLELVNVAPCSLPYVDGDPRARFTIFTWASGAWQIERHWVEYDFRQEVAALNASDHPSKTQFAGFFAQAMQTN